MNNNEIQQHNKHFIKQLATNYKLMNYGYRSIISEKWSSPIVEDNTMKFYKRSNEIDVTKAPRLYQMGQGDLKFHWIPEEPTFKDLYKDFVDHEIEEIVIPDNKIGDEIFLKRDVKKNFLEKFLEAFGYGR